MRRVESGQGVQRLGRGIHRFEVRAAVHMDIDETGQQRRARGIDHDVGSWGVTATVRGDATVANEQPATRNDAERGDDLRIDKNT